MKDKTATVLKMAVSLGLIAFIFTRPEIRLADWATILSDLRLLPWLLALALYFAAVGVNVLKWRGLLRTLRLSVPYLGLYRHTLVGLFFANLPLSVVGGDIARGWDLARTTEGQAAEVAISVVVDRMIGLAAFLVASVVGLGCAVVLLGRTDLAWLLTTAGIGLIGFALGFTALLSRHLRLSLERVFSRGPLRGFQGTYRKLSDAAQVYRNHASSLALAFALGLGTVAITCLVNYLAAVSVGSELMLAWVLLLTPLTAFAPLLPSIASGLGWNQGVYIVLYYVLAKAVPGQAEALAMSLAMQALILTASLPGGVLWWRRREASPRERSSAPTG